MFLTDVPSASGIEIFNGNYYIIGDNSPFLFELNSKLVCIKKIPIFERENYPEIIPKKSKPDFEAMTTVLHTKEFDFYIFGSGASSPQRDILVKISIQNDYRTEWHSLTDFYRHIKANGIEELNIEAAVATADSLFLFNRSDNKIITCSIQDFEKVLIQSEYKIKLEIVKLILPTINQLRAGFSGASSLNDSQLVFSCSVENTPNAIDDGEILGSYIGVIALSEIRNELIPTCLPVLVNNQMATVKIESVVRNPLINEFIELIMISDSDNNESEIFFGKLEG